jgi:hypothetical protein
MSAARSLGLVIAGQYLTPGSTCYIITVENDTMIPFSAYPNLGCSRPQNMA